MASLVSARGLTELSPRHRPDADPLASAVEGAALLITLAAFALLGRAVGRSGAPARAGAIAGLLGGLAAGVAQASGVASYLDAALARYNVPDWFLAGSLGVYVLLETAVMVTLGAGAAWAGSRYLGPRGELRG